MPSSITTARAHAPVTGEPCEVTKKHSSGHHVVQDDDEVRVLELVERRRRKTTIHGLRCGSNEPHEEQQPPRAHRLPSVATIPALATERTLRYHDGMYAMYSLCGIVVRRPQQQQRQQRGRPITGLERPPRLVPSRRRTTARVGFDRKRGLRHAAARTPSPSSPLDLPQHLARGYLQKLGLPHPGVAHAAASARPRVPEEPPPPFSFSFTPHAVVVQNTRSGTSTPPPPSSFSSSFTASSNLPP